MQDIQFLNATMERHRAILARDAAVRTAAAATPKSETFAAALEQAAPAPVIVPPAAAAASPAPAPAPAAATPTLSAGQMAMLLGSLGASAAEPAPAAGTKMDEARAAAVAAAAKTGAPELSPDQMAMLMSSFGLDPATAAAAPTAPIVPAARKVSPTVAPDMPPPAAAAAALPVQEARFFPINRQGMKTSAATASDVYLNAVKTIEQNAGTARVSK